MLGVCYRDTPCPSFFVSVDSKGFRIIVSALESTLSTLMRGLTSVDFKGVRLSRRFCNSGLVTASRTLWGRVQVLEPRDKKAAAELLHSRVIIVPEGSYCTIRGPVNGDFEYWTFEYNEWRSSY
jgi:hypothetical protein